MSSQVMNWATFASSDNELSPPDAESAREGHIRNQRSVITSTSIFPDAFELGAGSRPQVEDKDWGPMPSILEYPSISGPERLSCREQSRPSSIIARMQLPLNREERMKSGFSRPKSERTSSCASATGVGSTRSGSKQSVSTRFTQKNTQSSFRSTRFTVKHTTESSVSSIVSDERFTRKRNLARLDLTGSDLLLLRQLLFKLAAFEHDPEELGKSSDATLSRDEASVCKRCLERFLDVTATDIKTVSAPDADDVVDLIASPISERIVPGMLFTTPLGNELKRRGLLQQIIFLHAALLCLALWTLSSPQVVPGTQLTRSLSSGTSGHSDVQAFLPAPLPLGISFITHCSFLWWSGHLIHRAVLFKTMRRFDCLIIAGAFVAATMIKDLRKIVLFWDQAKNEPISCTLAILQTASHIPIAFIVANPDSWHVPCGIKKFINFIALLFLFSTWFLQRCTLVPGVSWEDDSGAYQCRAEQVLSAKEFYLQCLAYVIVFIVKDLFFRIVLGHSFVSIQPKFVVADFDVSRMRSDPTDESQIAASASDGLPSRCASVSIATDVSNWKVDLENPAEASGSVLCFSGTADLSHVEVQLEAQSSASDEDVPSALDVPHEKVALDGPMRVSKLCLHGASVKEAQTRSSEESVSNDVGHFFDGPPLGSGAEALPCHFGL